MQLKIVVRCGGEVRWADGRQDTQVYYGGPPPESGVWRLSINQLEDYLCTALAHQSYGSSIDTFILDFHIAELEGWGHIFTSRRDHMSYMPRTKAIGSVGQLNWPDVKDLSAKAQLREFARILCAAITRIAEMKRKPKHFDSAGLSAAVARLLAQCPIASISAPEGENTDR